MLAGMTRQPDPSSFTADAFIGWAMQQPRGRFELVRGQVVAMSPERAGHTRTKGSIFRALWDAIARAGLGCEAFTDGMAVRIDGSTVDEPDALVRCRPRTPDVSVEIPDPIIAVEVVSPPSRSFDKRAQAAGLSHAAERAALSAARRQQAHRHSSSSRRRR
jgi:Uma2 family endonuclease